jgi:chromate transporter
VKRDFRLYLTLFLTTFQLSAFTFGGGYVIVSLMKKKFVEKLKWIEEKEMLDMIAVAQSSPGAIAINTSIILGYKMGGVLGALVTVFGTALPPLIIISVISLFYDRFRNNTIIEALMRGMQAGVAAVIADVVISLTLKVVKTKNAVSVIIMTASFIAAFFFRVNVGLIILASALIGLAMHFINRRKIRKETQNADT